MADAGQDWKGAYLVLENCSEKVCPLLGSFPFPRPSSNHQSTGCLGLHADPFSSEEV